MEFVALSTDVLNTLAKEDRCLKRMFQGVYPASSTQPEHQSQTSLHRQHGSSRGTGSTLAGHMDRRE